MSSSPRLPPAATPVARLETDEQSAWRIAALLAESLDAEETAVSLVDGGAGRWRVTVYFAAAPDRDAIRALAAAAAGPAATRTLRFARVAAKDWIRQSLTGLAPVEAGRFVVHGAHDRARIAANRIGIEIAAALAFGTGHHGTTRGCLLALDRLCRLLGKPRAMPVVRRPGMHAAGAPGAARRRSARGAGARILDLGTGSGILGIAAARALRRRVLAIDIDANAVRAARANARLNRVGAMVEVARMDGVSGRRARRRAPFELVLANITLRPLQRFACALAKLTAPGARIVLSGLQPAEVKAAIAAYRGLALERRIELAGWTTLVLARSGRRRARRRRCS